MQLFEVKNDIAKIMYNPSENHLLPSDFVLIEDTNQKLIAQILNTSTTTNSYDNVANARLVLAIDKSDNLSYYNGYIPSKSSVITYINPDEIIELIQGTEEGIYVGNLSTHSDCFVKLPSSFIDENVYIQSDRDDKTKTIIQNIVTELISKDKKTILLDFDGRYSSIVNVERLKIGENFKFPLNIEAFNNILEYDTTDCPIEDKAVIQSIVLELREYLKTIENNFLPFTTFKNVVEEELSQNSISGLMLLRNKLWLYAQDGIFAENKSQFDVINSILEKQNVLIIDASNIEEKWYKYAIQTIAELTEKNCYFVISLNDVQMDKKSIINLYNISNITPIVSTAHNCKYKNILKSVCKNQILLKPSSNTDDDELYNALLSKINSGEFIVYGESTLYLPLIIELQSFDSSTAEEVVQNEIKKDVDKLLSSSRNKSIPANATITEESNIVEDNYDIDEDIEDSDFDFLDELNNSQETQIVENEDYGVFNPDTELDSSNEIIDETELTTTDSEEEFEEYIEETNDEKAEEMLVDENYEEEVVEETEDTEEFKENEEVNEESVAEYDEEAETESEIEFIEDEYTEDSEPENEEEIITPPPIKDDVNTKDTIELPVYETDNSADIQTNEIPFKIGDKVYHPKHGNGVIEGFANYSNKILFCQIEFENVGRRILDPRIAGIEKIS